MDEDIYENLYENEMGHWWFAARRTISRTVLKRFVHAPQAQVLEVGCGSGGNLAMLSEFGPVVGVEMNEKARIRAESRGIAKVMDGYLPDHMPAFPPQTLITAFDVVEHVKQDDAALLALYNQLAPGGILMITVPALPWMWSEHDVRHHHFRRYTRKQLQQKLEAAGFRIEQLSYINTVLSPLIIAVRLLSKILKRHTASVDNTPHPLLNTILYHLFACERFALAKEINLPIGISLLAVARRP